eukprot:6204925-Pleurochrysis_carterae.AAC.2
MLFAHALLRMRGPMRARSCKRKRSNACMQPHACMHACMHEPLRACLLSRVVRRRNDVAIANGRDRHDRPAAASDGGVDYGVEACVEGDGDGGHDVDGW